MFKKLFSYRPVSNDWAALILRVCVCMLMVYNHGFVKITLFSESPDSFPDPIGIGASLSYYLVLFAESVCSVLVLLGLFTRLALIPLLVTMSVATLRVNWDNSLIEKELPLLYLAVFLSLWLTGAGRFSLDAMAWKRWFQEGD